MNISPSNEKIEKYLDELSDEYRTLLFKALVSRSTSIDELSISELLRLDAEIKKPLLGDYQRQQRRRKMFLTVGLTYMVLGFVMFVAFQIMNTDFMYSPNAIMQLMSLILAVFGIFTSIVGFIYPTLSLSSKRRMKSTKEESPALLEYEIVTKWRELEGIVNDLSLSLNVKTPRSIIEFLLDNQFIDSEEQVVLKKFLIMRNDVVHLSSKVYTTSNIKEMLTQIDKVIIKLGKIV